MNPWAELYEPSRKSLRSLPSMLAHDVEINAQYKDYFLPGDVHDIEDIPRCSGAVMRNGMRKVAVYRDEAGTVHQFSAACPHLGGIVRWNAAEKTWDCPVYVMLMQADRASEGGGRGRRRQRVRCGSTQPGSWGPASPVCTHAGTARAFRATARW